jgi:AbrB family looped-hinge helix DNA binding protein
MTKGYETVLTRANKSGKSLRTTLPASIRDQFGLKEGDKVSWKLEIKDNEFIIVVKPIKR